ncbi:MAG: hypothetical protein IJS54_07855 [Desulfovibrio sp.]|nr:hypothetical protein [Desulfovibrio sp.]
MVISWHIQKKRGYRRPMLTYAIELEAHEKALCLPAMRIPSTIAEPLDSWQEHCWPGQYERADPPQLGSMYTIDIPSHEGRHWQQSLRLPWRADNGYPEVEETFSKVREVFEQELMRAYDSLPMDETKNIKSTQAFQHHCAPGVIAERFLQFARNMQMPSAR